MQAYERVLELAHICAKNAHLSTTPDVARELWKMAKEYQRKAATMDNGKLPDIGPPPSSQVRY
jgi:hypothetical protein